MNALSRLLIITLIVAVAASPAYVRSLTIEESLQEVEKVLDESVRILDRAHLGVVDNTQIGSIVSSLNEVLRLVESARKSMNDGDTQEAETIKNKALSLAQQAKQAAETLSEASARKDLQQKIVAGSLVLVASIITAIVAAKGHKWRSERERRKLLMMSIRTREETEGS